VPALLRLAHARPRAVAAGSLAPLAQNAS